MRYKVKTNRVRPGVCDFFFLVALAIVSQKTERYLKKSLIGASHRSPKKKEIPDPFGEKEGRLLPKHQKIWAQKAKTAASTRKFSREKRPRKQHFFSTRKHFDRVSPLSRSSRCSRFHLSLSLSLCARDFLFCCLCRRLSSRSTTTKRER